MGAGIGRLTGQAARCSGRLQGGWALLPLVGADGLLRAARAAGYAVGAFSVHTPEMVDAVFAAAEARGAPVLLQVGQRAIRHAGLQETASWVIARAARSPVPAALHLDHSRSWDQVVRALRAGCTSVMFDGSDLPFADNVAATAAVVRLAHAAGVPAEGEVGRVGGVEDDPSEDALAARLASVEQAVRFVQDTGVDSLAPAVGNVHGLSDRIPRLDLGRLRVIGEAVAVPLVLHGGSGLDEAQLRAAVAAGVAKVNVDTELRHAFLSALRVAVNGPDHADDPYPALAEARRAVAELAQRRIDTFGSAGRA